jgi:hypothetical protein
MTYETAEQYNAWNFPTKKELLNIIKKEVDTAYEDGKRDGVASVLSMLRDKVLDTKTMTLLETKHDS